MALSVSSRRRVALLVAVAASGCLYDGDDRCGDRVLVDGVCVCPPDMTEDTAGNCVCGPNESPVNGTCQCNPGTRWDATLQVCELNPLGRPCDPAGTNTCPTEVPACVEDDFDGSGYCTTEACTSSVDCDPEYACNLGGTPAYCQRPPLGQGAPCDEQSDCAGYEATYCEARQEHRCFVRDCTLGGTDCFEGWECCDLSAYVIFGVPPTMCSRAGSCP